MKQGLVWFDNDPRKSLDEKVVEAIHHYKDKFGVDPLICYVNPTQLGSPKSETANGNAAHLNSQDSLFGKLRVISSPQVLMNHIWLEIEK